MKNAIIAAIVAAVVASAGAGAAYQPPTRAELDSRVMVLEEKVATLELGLNNNRATFASATETLARCMAKPESAENLCIRRLVAEGRLP